MKWILITSFFIIGCQSKNEDPRPKNDDVCREYTHLSTKGDSFYCPKNSFVEFPRLDTPVDGTVMIVCRCKNTDGGN